MKIVPVSDIRRLFKIAAENPEMKSRRLERAIGKAIGHTAIDKYFRILLAHGYAPGDVVMLTDEQMEELFGVNPKKTYDAMPDFNKVFEYMNEYGVCGGRLHTLQQAYEFFYIKEYFPDVAASGLPSGCMSKRTFERYYAEYLVSKGLGICRHSPNTACNFGPVSMMEIDTLGDPVYFIDKDSNRVRVIIFTAVLKYSGYLFAWAMPSSSGLCWSEAIIEACRFFGGTCPVIRCDNDSAICLHNRRFGSTCRLRPSVAALISEPGMVPDLCPIRRPEWKGSCERNNSILETELFADPACSKPLHAADIEEFNKMLLKELQRINNKPRQNHQLSRQAVYDLFERDRMNQIPVYPVPRCMSIQSVRRDGYIYYQKNYYYAGTALNRHLVVVENVFGKTVRILNEADFKEVVSYELYKGPDVNRHFKDPKFATDREKIFSRTEDWFITAFAETASHDNIDAFIHAVFKRLEKTPAVAVRLCNQVYSTYESFPEEIKNIDEVCGLAISGHHFNDFKYWFRHSFNLMREMKKAGCPDLLYGTENSRSAQNDGGADAGAGKAGEEENTRGGDYYEQL